MVDVERHAQVDKPAKAVPANAQEVQTSHSVAQQTPSSVSTSNQTVCIVMAVEMFVA